jgi:hypothetical protein
MMLFVLSDFDAKDKNECMTAEEIAKHGTPKQNYFFCSINGSFAFSISCSFGLAHLKNPSTNPDNEQKMKLWPLLKTMVLVFAFAAKTQAQSMDTTSTQLAALKAEDAMLAVGGLNFGGAVLAPFRYGDKVFFTATQPSKHGNGKVSRLFYSLRNEPAQLLPINPKEDDTNAAHACFNATADRIYYTVFKEAAPGKLATSEICYRDKQYDGSWGNIVKLPKHVNKSGTTNTQPACGYDFYLKKDLLFFASNRAGGMGGFDIWYCTADRDGSFGNPTHLPFNGPGDDVTPHFFSQEQTLFFSAYDYQGKGGFDIYSSKKNANGEWAAPTSLDQLNTPFDELYFSYHQPSQTSYFCSNRPNDNCQNQPTGCIEFSIFSAKIGGSLHLKLMNERDSSDLFGCNVELLDAVTGATESVVLKSEANCLDLPILSEKKYRLIVSREGFFPIFLDLELGIGSFAQPTHKTVYLKPMR